MGREGKLIFSAKKNILRGKKTHLDNFLSPFPPPKKMPSWSFKWISAFYFLGIYTASKLSKTEEQNNCYC